MESGSSLNHFGSRGPRESHDRFSFDHVADANSPLLFSFEDRGPGESPQRFSIVDRGPVNGPNSPYRPNLADRELMGTAYI
jgi:hypothetical protein